MKLNTMKSYGFALLCGLIATGCSTTKMGSEEVADVSAGAVSNILVIGLTNVDENRKAFENRFVMKLREAGVAAVASADLLDIPANERLKRSDVINIMDQQGNDAVIVATYLGTEEADSYKVSADDARYFHNHYNHASAYADAGANRDYNYAHLQTNLYSRATEDLMWSGTSDTWNPQSASQIIDGTVDSVIKDLKRQGLIK